MGTGIGRKRRGLDRRKARWIEQNRWMQGEEKRRHGTEQQRRGGQRKQKIENPIRHTKGQKRINLNTYYVAQYYSHTIS